MRVAFIGCVEFSHAALAHCLTLPDFELAGVVTRRASRFHADFRTLQDLARGAGAPVFFARGNNQEAMADWLQELVPEAVFCFGWPYLLLRRVLDLTPGRVVGYHPAALPQNRGRHPIIWALVLGLESTASTFFLMDEGADSGPIISQEPVAISAADDAGTLYEKLTRTALGQLTRMLPPLVLGTLRRWAQDEARANTWRKRSPRDGEIDWRLSAAAIHNLVRALARPYPGAHCTVKGEEIKVWRTRPEGGAAPNLEPGKVLAVDGGGIVVKCWDGAIRLVEHGFDELPAPGSYL